MGNTTALERALQSILDEVDGKADASREPGEEREMPNIYMRIQMAADEAMAEAKRHSGLLSDESQRARELWAALANLSFHCDGVIVTCPPPRTVYNEAFAVMDRFKPLYGPKERV